MDQKPGGVALGAVERQPGDGPLEGVEPFAEQRGFSKARRGRDQGQGAGQPGVELRDEMAASDPFRPGRGAVELGG